MLIAVAAAYVVYIFLAYRLGFEQAARGERPLFTDFTSTYGAALLLRQEAPEFLYHPEHISRATEAAGNAAYGGVLTSAQRKVGFAPWMYPPTFILFVVPLGFLSYFAALAGWLALTSIPYLLAGRAILGRVQWAVPAMLAAPPYFYNAMFGQTSLLPAGLIGLGLVSLQRQPWLAGVFIGLASVKPHLGLLIPVALAAGGYWRTFLAATGTVIGLIVVSVIAFGSEPWFAFIGISIFHLQGFEHGAYTWKFMTSVLGATHLAGAGLGVAWLVQTMATATMVAVVASVWWRGRGRPETLDLRAAVLCCAVPLAVPLVFVYDLVVVVIGLAFLLQDMRVRGSTRGEAVVVFASMLGMLLVKGLGAVPGVALGVLAVVALGFLSLLRWRRFGRPGE